MKREERIVPYILQNLNNKSEILLTFLLGVLIWFICNISCLTKFVG